MQHDDMIKEMTAHSHSQWMHDAQMYVQAPLRTFVVAWPGIRQCCLCNVKERARALAQPNAHTH